MPTQVELVQALPAGGPGGAAAGLEVHHADRTDPHVADQTLQQLLDLVQLEIDEPLGQGEDVAHWATDRTQLHPHELPGSTS